MSKKVLTIGCFDLLHKGHINLFHNMRQRGEWVIVIVHDDRSIYENKLKFPVQDLDHRMRNIEMTGLVDEMHAVHTADPSDILQKVISQHSPEEIVYMRGNDWGDFPGKSVLERNNIKIEFIQYTDGVSSTKLRDEL